MSWYQPSGLGFAVRSKLADLGYGARLFLRLLGSLGAVLRRPALVVEQIHFMGNYSLTIIGVSGAFVGFVLALQGYYTLQRYGSSEALGLLVALALVRELGPVITALLFAGRAGKAAVFGVKIAIKRPCGSAANSRPTTHGGQGPSLRARALSADRRS